MDMQTIQRLLTDVGYYKGAFDGYGGPATNRALKIIETNAKNRALYTTPPEKMVDKRRLIAAAQVILHWQNFQPGPVDGYAGHNTINALNAWEYVKAHGKKLIRARKPKIYKPQTRKQIPLQKDLAKFYGKPGKGNSEVYQNLIEVNLPYPMRLDWNLNQKITSVKVHKKCAKQYVAAKEELLQHYGLTRIQEFGIDRFAGLYNPRLMRNGKSWSTHAYGCAEDLFARPNGLTVSCPDALFCGSDYTPLLDIMEKHGWLPAIRLWGKDAMHFQYARLR